MHYSSFLPVSFLFIIFTKHFPALWRHKSFRQGLALARHLPHSRSRDEVEVGFVRFGAHEVHGLLHLVIGCKLKGNDLDAQFFLDCPKQLLPMPDIITVLILVIWMLDSSRIPSRDKMRDIAASSRRGMPEDFSRATIIHRRWPNRQNGMIWDKRSII